MRRRRGYRKRKHWHTPEQLDGQDDRDARYENRRYFVYVLETTSGHYVGHTYSVRNRVARHKRGQTRSTAGTAPELAWTSRPFGNRAEAARFEAALKSLRDQKHPRFHEITDLEPQPWVFNATRHGTGPGSNPAPQAQPQPNTTRHGTGPVLWIVLGILAVIFLLAAIGPR
ncbi:MAG: hypothetical protein GDA53_08610 [Rhodobacteraceae bacterium]|nr:hypothetical protein [Paracoccaceae bacterium]